MRYWIAPIFVVLCALFGLCASPSGAGETSDRREPAPRTDVEKTFVLEQMRLLLSSIVEIEEGLGSNDMDLVARAAAARGRKANVTLARPATLAAKESEAWKSMFASVRGGFDQIADEAAARTPTTQINKKLADVMGNCVACHQTYRIVDAP